MASTNKSHTTPPGLNLVVVLLILAALAVALGCWFDDEVHRHTEHGAVGTFVASADIETNASASG